MSMVSTITFEPSIQPNELRSLGATWQSRLELEELPEVFHQVREVRTLSQRPFCRMVCTRTMAPG